MGKPLQFERCTLNGHVKGLVAYFGFEEEGEEEGGEEGGKEGGQEGEKGSCTSL